MSSLRVRQTVKRFMVHCELKIMPLVTKTISQPVILCRK